MTIIERVTIICLAFAEKYSDEITMFMLILSLLFELAVVVVELPIVVVELARIGEVVLVFSLCRLRLS